MNPLLGKKIEKIFVADDRHSIKFSVNNGEEFRADCDGDCCSHTWIENVSGVDQLIGGTVISVEDIGGMETRPTTTGYYEEEMSYYGCKITTDKGFGVIEYRNSSNGYYYGNLSWGDEYYYGGVYKQNVSSSNWVDIKEFDFD